MGYPVPHIPPPKMPPPPRAHPPPPMTSYELVHPTPYPRPRRILSPDAQSVQPTPFAFAPKEKPDKFDIPTFAIAAVCGVIALSALVFVVRRYSKTRSEDATQEDFNPPVAPPPALVPSVHTPPVRYLPPAGIPSGGPPPPPPPAPTVPVPQLSTFFAAEGQRETQCGICLEPFGTQPLAAGACAHIFHASCITRWLARDANRSCPVCRLPFDGAGTEIGETDATVVVPPLPEAYAPTSAQDPTALLPPLPAPYAPDVVVQL